MFRRIKFITYIIFILFLLLTNVTILTTLALSNINIQNSTTVDSSNDPNNFSKYNPLLAAVNTDRPANSSIIDKEVPPESNFLPDPKIPAVPIQLPVQKIIPSDDIDFSKPMIALTFDDGPSTNATGRILDLIEVYNIKATFFIVGNRLETSSVAKALLTRADKLGCEIGNHTYDHKDLSKLGAEEIKSQISHTDDLVKSIISKNPHLVRPPYGKYNKDVVDTLNVPMIFWSVDSEDWKSRNAETIVNIIKDNTKDGDIILMHDLYSSTADACEIIIPYLLEQGYQLVTVSELFYYKEIELNLGIKYRNAR